MNFDCGATLFQTSNVLCAESKCEKSAIIYFDEKAFESTVEH